jgi:hypothetical protein
VAGEKFRAAKRGPELPRKPPCDGVACVTPDSVLSVGRPPTVAIAAAEQMDDRMTASDDANSPNPTRLFINVLWLALGIVFCLHVLLRLVQQSMLGDGALYAAIARNLAAGEGSWWRLHFSNTLFSYFAEHPPLLIWLEAVGFMLFGDHLAVEKTVSLLAAVTNGIILLAIWRQLSRESPATRGLGVGALLLCLVSGKIGSAFANGLIENLLMVFTSLAVLLILVAYRPANAGGPLRTALIVAAGLAIILALMSKGPVALFPLAVPAIHWAVFRTPSLLRVVLDTAILAGLVLGFIGTLLLIDAPHQYLIRYVSEQLFSSLSGARGDYGGGWKALLSLVSMMIYSLSIASIVLLISFVIGRTRPAAERPAGNLARSGIFLIIVGISASLPLFVSPRISTFYFNPSLEYFATALACICAPAVLTIVGRVSARALRRTQLVLAVGLAASLLLVAAKVGSPGRDRDLLADVAKVAAYICPSAASCEKSVAACGSVWEEWELHAYLQRHHRVDLAQASSTAGRGLLLTNADCAAPDPGSAREVDIGLAQHRLFRFEAVK